jgi:excisionase family DNA binding protein
VYTSAYIDMKGGEIGMEGREEYLTTAQAAQRLHMKPATLARKLNDRTLPGVKVGRQWLIKKETVDAMLEPQLSAPQGT